MSRYLDARPHPWTLKDIEKAIVTNFTEAREAIEETEGAKLWHSLSDLQDIAWMFQKATTELLDEISLFGDRSRNPAFWNQVNDMESEAHTKEVKRFLFNCTSSLMALVEQARNFHKSYPVDEYTDHLKKFFPTAGLHSFLQCLRNYNTHWRVADSNWTINYDFSKGGREARFVVSKKELLRWKRWRADSLVFINAADDPIDIHRIFSDYRKSAQDFHSWHHSAVLAQHAATYQPYLKYKRIHEGINKRMGWNFRLDRTSKSANVYHYVSRYLTKQQLETLLSLELGSEAQVDALIAMQGMEVYCTPELRLQAASALKTAFAAKEQGAEP